MDKETAAVFNPMAVSETDVNLAFHRKVDRPWSEEPNAFIPEALEALNRKGPLLCDVMNAFALPGLSEDAIRVEPFAVHPFSISDILNVLAVDDLLPASVNER